jgi:hypothetical protein
LQSISSGRSVIFADFEVPLRVLCVKIMSEWKVIRIGAIIDKNIDTLDDV